MKRRRPIFPWGCPQSIVRAEELNFRVRDGNGCTLFATATGSPAHTGGFTWHGVYYHNQESLSILFSWVFPHTRKVVIVVANIQCPNCKESISPEAQSCPHCGVQLQTQVHKSGLTPGELKRPLPDVVKQFDASATTNITIAGVLIAFYSGAIFAGKVISAGLVNAFLYALPLGLLLVAIVLALRVFYPDGYLTDDYPTLIKKKEKRLFASSIFLEVAIGILVISVFVYLLRSA